MSVESATYVLWALMILLIRVHARCAYQVLGVAGIKWLLGVAAVVEGVALEVEVVVRITVVARIV